MGNLELLTNALGYMEERLQEDIRTEDIARACYCSKSTIDKLFHCAIGISVRDYLVRRRMTKAAKLLIEQPRMSVLDIALLSGYSTHESFSRAFKQIWNCQPSVFRRTAKYSELFPRVLPPLENGDEYMMERRNFDISELYDLLRSRMGCYFICCDIKGLVPINEISLKAGDLAILESMRRMQEAAGEEDIVFRIGGDEFAMLTNSKEAGYGEAVAEKIRACNGETFTFEGQQIPLDLHVGILRFEKEPLKYNELFTELHTALRDAKPSKA